MRYFYTDPLAAEWMNDKFDMIFTSEKGRQIAIFDGFIHVGADEVKRAYIHPDSLHLLKPQLGDWIKIDELAGGAVSDKSEETKEAVVYFDGYCVVAHFDDIEIIQRNGLAFHWPESDKPDINDTLKNISAA